MTIAAAGWSDCNSSVFPGRWLGNHGFLLRRLRLQERLKAIEHRRDLSFDPEVRAAETRRAGIVLFAAGIGVVLADSIVTAVTADLRVLGFLALATVTLAVGLGLLLEHRLQLRDIRQRNIASPEKDGCQ